MADPLTPKNNWEMAEMLREGFTCRVASKHIHDILATLEYHGINAVVEQEDKNTCLVIPSEK